MTKIHITIGQIVHDRALPVSKGVAIVVGTRPGQLRICRWRGAQQHWRLPVSIDEKQLQPIIDWTLIPLTEAKRLAATAFERNYLVQALESVKGSVVEAAHLAGVHRSNFRRLLQRHALVKMPSRPKRLKPRTRRRELATKG